MCGIAGFLTHLRIIQKKELQKPHFRNDESSSKSTVGRMMKVRFSPLNAGLPMFV